jgi:hypothetical protein
MIARMTAGESRGAERGVSCTAPFRVLAMFATVAALTLTACGRTPVVVPSAEDGGADGGVEACNGLDDDGDLALDEDFRDERGRYVSRDHCGDCDRACDRVPPNALSVGCGLVDGSAACVALACADGYVVSTGGSCVELHARVCLPCVDDGDCGSAPTASCATVGTEARCTHGCADGCPPGYVCFGGDYCVPDGEDCHCDDGELFELACPIEGAREGCVGRRDCDRGRLSECRAPEERCNEEDDDCDGVVDEGYRDARNAYSLQDHHCGACGIDCTADSVDGMALACGGDPFAPTCVTRCPDLANGLHVGDRVDADGRIDNGCECRVDALEDASTTGGSKVVDANCDGADGEVIESFYVATDGNDAGPGSPTLPLRTIGVALARAEASLSTAAPRRHIYVASGTYTESLRVPDGVFLHGGYRRDYLARSLRGFEVVVIAPVDTALPGGAAMLVDHAGTNDTLVEGIAFRGRDASAPGAPAIGLVVDDPGSALALRELSVRSGKPGPGEDGVEGRSGASPTDPATDGEPQRAALEGDTHLCLAVPANSTRGGRGGTNSCDGFDVSGGQGGSPVCPDFGVHAPDGQAGSGIGAAPGGAGGLGGTDVQGPIFGGSSCPGADAVCCGLADFTVPTLFPQPEPGDPGTDGANGAAGAACIDARGAFFGTAWAPALAQSGTAGTAAGGGGGGGAGGGAEMVWTMVSCEWPDGLGGAGGGGGAGGCGGRGGGAGQSGGPAIAILIVTDDVDALPLIEDVTLASEDGASGGDGGAGGDGGQGGGGGFGGALADAMRTTPTLAGALPGQRGGRGGDGGAGGGGGGGCGGASVGLWITGLGAMPAVADFYRDGNSFEVGAGGARGQGGGGPVPAADGLQGSEVDVLVR